MFFSTDPRYVSLFDDKFHLLPIIPHMQCIQNLLKLSNAFCRRCSPKSKQFSANRFIEEYMSSQLSVVIIGGLITVPWGTSGTTWTVAETSLFTIAMCFQEPCLVEPYFDPS